MNDKHPIRVQIVGDHPWTGHFGTAVAIEKPSIGILPEMVRVRLDNSDEVPHDHECYVEKENLRIERTRR